MKNAFFNKRGDVIQYLLILLTYLGIVGFFTYKLFATGHWILGTLVTIFLLIPGLLVLIKKITGVDIEKKIDELDKKE